MSSTNCLKTLVFGKIMFLSFNIVDSFFVVCFCSPFLLFVCLDRAQKTKGIEMQLTSKSIWANTLNKSLCRGTVCLT